MPGQRPEALAGRRVPHLERAVQRPGHDAAVRQDGDAPDLRLAASTCNRRFCSTGRRRRAKSVCPVSVAAQRKRPRAAMGCALASARSRWHRILRRPGRLDLIGVLWGRGEMNYILNSGAHRVSRNVGLFRFRSLLAARIQRASRGRPRRDDAHLPIPRRGPDYEKGFAPTRTSPINYTNKLHPVPTRRGTRKRNRQTVLEERGDETPGRLDIHFK